MRLRHVILIAACALVAPSCKSDAASRACAVTNPEIIPGNLSLKVGATVQVGFSADYSTACSDILADQGTWTSSDPTTVTVAQSVTNPLIATLGGVKLGGPVTITFVGGPVGIATTTARLTVSVIAPSR